MVSSLGRDVLWQEGREERGSGKVLLRCVAPECRHHRDGVNGGHSCTSTPLPLILSSVHLDPACLVGYENLSVRDFSSLSDGTINRRLITSSSDF